MSKLKERVGDAGLIEDAGGKKRMSTLIEELRALSPVLLLPDAEKLIKKHSNQIIIELDDKAMLINDSVYDAEKVREILRKHLTGGNDE